MEKLRLPSQTRYGCHYPLDRRSLDSIDAKLATPLHFHQNWWSIFQHFWSGCDLRPLVTGTFVPGNFRSQERKFHGCNFRSLDLLFPKTFVLNIKISMELSFPNIA